MTGNGLGGFPSGLTVHDVFPDAGTEYGRADKGRDPAHGVDSCRTREVHKAKLRQPALLVPYPASLNGVDHQADYGAIEAVCAEFSALGHRAGDNGGRCGAKYQIEDEAGKIEMSEVGKNPQVGYPDESEQIVLGAHQTEAEEDKTHRADTEVHKVLHDDVGGIFRAGKARLHHRKTTLHKKY